MVTAFVLMKSEMGAEKDLLERIRKTDSVEEAYVVVSLVSGKGHRVL